MALSKYEIVGVSGASHVEYKGQHYELDPEVLTDEQAELLYGKTPHIVKKAVSELPAAAPAEPTTLAPAPATTEAEPAGKPKRKRIGEE